MRAKFTTKTATLQFAAYTDGGTYKTFTVDDSTGSGEVRLAWDEDVYFRRCCGVYEDIETLTQGMLLYANLTPALLCEANATLNMLIEKHQQRGNLFTETTRPDGTSEWYMFYGELSGSFDLL